MFRVEIPSSNGFVPHAPPRKISTSVISLNRRFRDIDEINCTLSVLTNYRHQIVDACTKTCLFCGHKEQNLSFADLFI